MGSNPTSVGVFGPRDYSPLLNSDITSDGGLLKYKNGFDESVIFRPSTTLGAFFSDLGGAYSGLYSDF